MRLLSLAVVTLGSAKHVIGATDSPRPRGVGPEYAKHYKAVESFKCISHSEIELEASLVNDDYCDCPDGSDEPGTSACSHINETLMSIPGFYCKNKGHRPAYIPLTYVNDGVCDYDLCCDGSDEWAGVGAKCPDRCAEIGKEWKKQDERRQKAVTAATKRRKELAAESLRLRKEVEDRIKTLQTQVAGAQIKLDSLSKELSDIERREKSKVVKAPKEGGKLGVLLEVGKRRTEELRTSLQSVLEDRDDARSRLKELEALLATFKEEYNPNFNDEGVKRAVRAWEDYAARDKRADTEAAVERDWQEVLKADEENGLDWTQFQTEDTPSSDVDALYKIEEYLPKPFRDWLNQKMSDLRIALIENGILAASSTPSEGTETQAVQDARSARNAAENELKDIHNSIKTHEEDLTKDYGPADIFRTLKDQCISVGSGEYEYELCWMKSTLQKPKKGGANTGLGNFERFETVTVDEEVPADGRGLGSGERLAMVFENGQHCWNGPSRSTTVLMACAEKDEIWKVVEAEKCVYRMEVGTAAVCDADLSKHTTDRKKDEL